VSNTSVHLWGPQAMKVRPTAAETQFAQLAQPFELTIPA
jgi:hypothetical protein